VAIVGDDGHAGNGGIVAAPRATILIRKGRGSPVLSSASS